MSQAEKRRWNDAADKMLTHVQAVFDLASGFDTAVRDSVSDGLAYLVYAAFDCRAIALELKDFESINSFIDGSTAEWFRQRGYAEWYCCGAGAMFHTSRPRTLAERSACVTKGR